MLVAAYAFGMQGREHQYFVYILASRSRTLYIGSFTARYTIERLVHVEQFQYIQNAIAREKALKD